jgi:N-acyl-L-homoserine lactone synthetase
MATLQEESMTPMTAHRPHSMARMDDDLRTVFVCKPGRQLRSEDGLEYDAFDRDDTAYVIATDARGTLRGTARLLPTTRPYLLGTLYPALMHGLPLPASPQVWELSRFAAPDFDAALTHTVGWRPAPVAAELLDMALQAAAGLGAERVITVSPLGLERLLLRHGFRAHRAAPPLLLDGNPLFACWIEFR